MERLKILVADDESRMRKLVKDFLIKSILKYWKQKMAARHLICFMPPRILH